MLLVPLLAALVGEARAYDPVRGLPFPRVEVFEDTTYAHGWHLRVRTHRPAESAYTDHLLSLGLYVGTLQSMRAAERLGAADSKCRRFEPIDLYQISEEALNDPLRFPAAYIGGGNTGRSALWGYYDPGPNEPARDAIVVSPHDLQSNYRVVAHEIAHYWYQSLCLDRYTTQTSEAFAQEIEAQIGHYVPLESAPQRLPSAPTAPPPRATTTVATRPSSASTASVTTVSITPTVYVSVTPVLVAAPPVVLTAAPVRVLVAP